MLGCVTTRTVDDYTAPTTRLRREISAVDWGRLAAGEQRAAGPLFLVDGCSWCQVAGMDGLAGTECGLVCLHRLGCLPNRVHRPKPRLRARHCLPSPAPPAFLGPSVQSASCCCAPAAPSPHLSRALSVHAALDTAALLEPVASTRLSPPV